jgi:pyruvate/2-oxoglutarate dehydrogenase complex dihydrolipoamide dehydrogenase (E3) component
LSAADIKTTPQGYITTFLTLEIDIPNAYAPGDVKDDPVFTLVSYDDVRIIRDKISLQSFLI